MKLKVIKFIEGTGRGTGTALYRRIEVEQLRFPTLHRFFINGYKINLPLSSTSAITSNIAILPFQYELIMKAWGSHFFVKLI